MSLTSDENVKNSLQQLIETRLHRRQALQLMGGAAAVTTLAACGVTPGPKPQPQVPLRTNQVMLRARVRDLSGRDRDRLRAIATYVNPGNRSRVSITGEYWTVDKPIVAGKPGADFLGQGLDIVVFVRGETAADVQEWASQWPGILEVQSDSVEPVDLPEAPAAVVPNTPTFLVFERLAGEAAELRPIFGQLPAGVTVVSHNRLTSDQNRQVLVVRAASRELVREWVDKWVGRRNSIEILQLSNLSEQLLRPVTPVGNSLPAATAGQGFRALDNLGGRLVTEDQRPGTWLYRHQGTDRFLAVRNGTLTTVVDATAGDQWETTKDIGVDENISGRYFLRHTGTGLYLSNSAERYRDYVGAEPFQNFRPWSIPLVASQIIGTLDDDGKVRDYLIVDDQGNPSLERWTDWSFQPRRNWEQTTYTPAPASRKALEEVLEGDTHNAPWPEDIWRDNSDKDPVSKARWEAYNDIAGKLGKLPKDPLSMFDERAIDDAFKKVDKPWPPEYQYVKDHLMTEVKYQRTAEQWYGLDHYVDNFVKTVIQGQLTAVGEIQSRAPQPPETVLSFVLHLVVSSISVGLTVTGEGEPLAATLEGLMSNYEAAAKEEDLNHTTFAGLYKHMEDLFYGLNSQREHTILKLRSNWGKLEAFQNLVDTNVLQWPVDNLTPLYKEAQRRYKISVWQKVLRGARRYEGFGALMTGKSIFDLISEETKRIQENEYAYGIADFSMIAYGSYKSCGKVYEGFFRDFSYVVVSDEVSKILFEELEVSHLDFFLGRNGWGLPNNQSISKPL